MAATEGTVTVLDMNQEGAGRGAKIKARRELYGLGKKELSERAGPARDTLDRVEADYPGVQGPTYAKFERALDELAEEMGFDGHEPAALEVTMRDVYGIGELIFKSPSQDPDVLAEAVLKIIEGLKERQ